MHCEVLLSRGTLWSSCSRFCHCCTEPSRRSAVVYRYHIVFLFVNLTTLIYNIRNDRPGNMVCLCIRMHYFLIFVLLRLLPHSVFNSFPATRPKWGDIFCLIVIGVNCSHVLGLRVMFLMASVVTWYVMRIMCFSFCLVTTYTSLLMCEYDSVFRFCGLRC